MPTYLSLKIHHVGHLLSKLRLCYLPHVCYLSDEACAHRVRVDCYLFTESSCRRSFFDWATPVKLCIIVICMLIDCLLHQFLGSIQKRFCVPNRSAKLPWSATAPCTFAAAPSFQACLRAFIYTFCMCVRLYVYVCMCADMYLYIYACVCVFVHLCVYTRVHVNAYAYLCIDCGSWYQCFSVWTVSCMCMCFRVHMYAYAFVCRYICMCIFSQ